MTDTKQPRIIVTMDGGVIQNVEFKNVGYSTVLEVRGYDLGGTEIQAYLLDPAKHPTIAEDSEGFYYRKNTFLPPPKNQVDPIFDINKVSDR